MKKKPTLSQKPFLSRRGYSYPFYNTEFNNAYTNYLLNVKNASAFIHHMLVGQLPNDKISNGIKLLNRAISNNTPLTNKEIESIVPPYPPDAFS